MTPSFKRQLMSASLLAASAFLVACESKEEKAIKFAESGQAYLEEGDYKRAKLQFNNALAQNPTNELALEGAAEVAAQENDVVRQSRMLNQLLQQRPNDIDANNSFARLMLLSNEVERAKEHAGRVLAQDPDNISAMSVMGGALVVENRLDEATEMLLPALEKDPENSELYQLLAAGQIRADNYEEAMSIIDEGIENSDSPQQLLLIRLIFAEKFEGREEVIATFERLIEQSPDNGLFRQRLADYYLLKDKDFDTARRLYKESLPYLPDPTPVYTRLVAMDKEEFGQDKAEETLQTYIEDNPENRELRLLLPQFFCQTQQLDRCRREYEALLEEDDLTEAERIRLLNGLSDVAIAQRDFEGASASSEDVLGKDPSNPSALITKGQLLLMEEQSQDAIELFRTALNSEPGNAEGMVYLALAYEQSGQIDFADTQFARAIDEVGHAKSVVDQYRAFLVRQGRNEKARDVLSRYVRANPGDLDAAYLAAEDAVAQRRYAAAEATARQLQTINIYEERATSLLARSLIGQEAYEEALPVIEALYQENPNNNQYFLLRARTLGGLGRVNEVIEELQGRVSQENPALSDIILLSNTLRNTQDYAGAYEAAREGLNTHQDAEQLYILSYLAQNDLGNKEEALSYLRDGVENASTTTQVR
ncbi:MAG: tetratricopeptide repeat protein, partial [Pseudomonadota bacterium]